MSLFPQAVPEGARLPAEAGPATDVLGPVIPERLTLGNDSEEWKKIISICRASIGQVHASLTRPHEIYGTVSRDASAFYVDEHFGFVLTNKHVVGPGPCWGFVVFGDNIEFQIISVVYTDPETDFAVVLIDAAAARSAGIRAIPLAPERARPGLEICVVGNESNMQLAIARAVISRMDYTGKYAAYPSDIPLINNETILAAFYASGGRSGSPALDIEGRAVGLHMGGDSSKGIGILMSLDYPKRVLERLSQSAAITRGTLQADWHLKPLNECVSFGLPLAWEKRIRESEATSAIAVWNVLPEGPASTKLEKGDILLEVDGLLQTSLCRLSIYMDDHVTQEVSLKVWRMSREVDVRCRVGDLFAITPHRFISRLGATFHQMPWMLAIVKGVPARGVYVASSSERAVFGAGMLLVSINGTATPDLDQLSRALDSIREGGLVRTEHRALHDRQSPIRSAGYLPAEQLLHSIEMRRLPREGGGWVVHKATTAPSPGCGRASETTAVLSRALVEPAVTADLPGKNDNDGAVKRIFGSVVFVECHTIAHVSGHQSGETRSYGVLLDAEHGLVMGFRHCLSLFTDVIVTIAGYRDVKGRVIFVHETVDLALIQYDPASVPDEVEPISLSKRSLEEGDDIYYLAFHRAEPKVVRTQVETLGQHTLSSGGPAVFAPLSHETVRLLSAFSDTRSTGLLVFADGTVAGTKGVWKDSGNRVDYFLPASRIQAVLSLWRAGQLANARYQDFEVAVLPLVDAVRRGLPSETISYVKSHSSAKSQVLSVYQVPSHCTAPDGEKMPHPLQQSDIILELDGTPVLQSSDLQYIFTKPDILVRVLRAGQVIEVRVPTLLATEPQVAEVVFFCGAYFHNPTFRARIKSHPVHSGVFMTAVARGSPVQLCCGDVPPFVCAVGDKTIVTLEDFKDAIAGISDGVYFTMTLKWGEQTQQVALMKNESHFPTFSISRDLPFAKGTWSYRPYAVDQDAETEQAGYEVANDDEGHEEGVDESDADGNQSSS
ncbi:Pro-apoptotic serine protease [Pleurostoma richardsiae]|uniref:Pro-apoptotic serine protease NMA111 n=1 Tax=Pleurostoma richardsiae TaxID=41990 RepID=A0AA38R7Y6_9PEZI|nr:Pro-apoptotic serine protease [Pleurostoma richardsiae]